MSTNPVIQEIDGLSPSAKTAIQSAHEQVAPHTASLIAPQNNAVPHLSAVQPVPPGATATENAPVIPHQASMPVPQMPTDKMSGPPPLMTSPATAAPGKGTIQGDENERARLIQTGSGASQIKNPWLKGLAETGSALGHIVAPGISQLIPGTEDHHNLLLGRANRNVAGDLQNEEQGALIQKQQQQNQAEPQQAEDTHDVSQSTIAEHNAQASALLHPQAKTDFEAWQQQNPGKPIENWLQAQSATKEKSPEQQAITEYMTAHPGSTVMQAEHEYSLNTQRPPQVAPTMMMTPDGKGGFTAGVVRPGEHVDSGAVTPGGMSGQNVGKTKSQQKLVDAADDADGAVSEAEELASKPSATNDYALLMNFIGTTKPDSLGKLRLNNNEIKLVTGTRSSLGDLEALGNKVANGQMLTDSQRKQMIDTMRTVAGGTRRRASEVGGSEPTKGQGVDDKDPLKLF